jgi:hypothetical protein
MGECFYYSESLTEGYSEKETPGFFGRFIVLGEIRSFPGPNGILVCGHSIYFEKHLES